MVYKRLFLDSDVLLDLFLERQPFYPYMQLLLIKVEGKLEINTSALIIANVNYLLTKSTSKAESKERLKNFVNRINILPFDKQAIDFALNSSFTDFEDAIQHYIATENNCDLIITRNIKDYKNSTIPVLTTEQFLRTIL